MFYIYNLKKKKQCEEKLKIVTEFEIFLRKLISSDNIYIYYFTLYKHKMYF